MDALLARHRKEQRNLVAQVTQRKKNATKKTRRGVNDECERLERELAERQRAEVAALDPHDDDGDGDGDGAAEIEEAVDALTITDPPGAVNGGHESSDSRLNSLDPAPVPPGEPRAKKPNRQKARLARRAAEQEALAATAAAEAENLPDLREREMSAMKTQLETRHLSETQIRPDGHCLFSACAHSMPAALVATASGSPPPYVQVRGAAADYMISHPDDFAAFMEEPLDSYVRKIRDTAEWGGQLELQALARNYRLTINVLQADGRVDEIRGADSGPGDASSTIWLAYYRHSFGLGEHYNALKRGDAEWPRGA